MPYAAVNQVPVMNHGLNAATTNIAANADDYTTNAINTFMAAVSAPNATTGDIIKAAADLKMKLGASKAYYDVISSLGDDTKRIIEGAVK